MVQWHCKGGEATGTHGWQWNKASMSENPVSPWFGGPAQTGTSETGGGRSEENPENNIMMHEGAISPYHQFLGGFQWSTNATRITKNITTIRQPEWRRTESAMVEGVHAEQIQQILNRHGLVA